MLCHYSSVEVMEFSLRVKVSIIGQAIEIEWKPFSVFTRDRAQT